MRAALETDAMVEADSVRRVRVDGAVVCDAPGCPFTHWGHRVETDAAPFDDLERWLRVWRAHHGGLADRRGPGGRAIVAWEAGGDVAAPPVSAGVRVGRLRALELEEAACTRPATVELRALTADDWPALVALFSVAFGAPSGDDPYLAWRFRRARERVDQGRAVRLGAFVDGALVASAGVVWGDGVARMQDVMTHPDHRRRGLAGAVVSACAAARPAGCPLWVVADAESEPEALYRSLGFAPRTTVFELDVAAPRTDAQVRALTRAFEDASLDPTAWGHAEHLSVAVEVLRDAGGQLAPALGRMRASLLRFLAANGIESGPDRGYHETLTRGWLELVRAATPPDASLEDAVLRVTLALSDKRALLAHWSRDRIMSADARAEWIPPNLAPLPRPPR